MGNIFNTILVHPLLNLLVFFYQYIPDIGLVIILLTVLIRLLLVPSFHKSLKHQRALQSLQPKMNEVREKYKNDQEAQAKAMMELYKVHNVNPLSSCFPVLIQLPILISLYQVFIQSLNGQALRGLYSFISHPEQINPMFLGLVDLSAKGNYWLAAIAALLQFWQTKQLQTTNKIGGQNSDSTAKFMNSYLLYFFPLITFFIGIRFPAGLALYWVTTTLFGIAQQYYIIRKEAKEVLYGNK